MEATMLYTLFVLVVGGAIYAGLGSARRR